MCIWPLVNYNIQLKGAGGGDKILHDNPLKAMNLVNEKHVAFVESCNHTSKISAFF